MARALFEQWELDFDENNLLERRFCVQAVNGVCKFDTKVQADRWVAAVQAYRARSIK